MRKDLLDDGVGQRLVLGDAANDAGAVATAKAAQGQHRHMRLADPGRLELRPERDDQQHRQIGDAGNRSIEQIERCRIDPVGVLEHDQDGALRRYAVELVEKRRESHLSLLLRADRQRRVAPVRRHRQQLGDERHIAWHIPRRRLEQGLQLVELRSGAAARLEARGPLELRNERVERAVRMVGRAEIAKASMRLALEPRQQAFGDARLADAGLAGEQHDPTLAELGLIPTAQQQLDLLLPANERGQRARAPRLEPADAGRLAAHLPRLHRLRQPLHLVGTERAAVEHPPHQPPRAGRDHDLAGRCRGLQPRRQVWRLADRNTLPCVAGPQLLADDNQPGGDADARLKGHVGSGLQRADRVEDGKAGAHGLLGVMLMSCRVAEIDVHAIAQVLGDKSVKSRHHIGDHLVEGGDQIAHVLGVETCRKGHRADHIANHDRQLSPLGAARADRHRRRCRIAPRCRVLGVRLLRVSSQIGNGRHRNRRPVGLRRARAWRSP